jgi:thioredoxin 1
MNLIIFYSDSCGACKDYLDVADKLARAFNLTLQKQNIDVVIPSYKLSGIPTIILEKDGVEIYRSVGNLPYDLLLKDVNAKCLMNNTPKNS